MTEGRRAVENSAFDRVVRYFLGHEKPKEEPESTPKRAPAKTAKKPSTKPKKRA